MNTILLLGGQSVVGNAITNGLTERFPNSRIVRISRDPSGHRGAFSYGGFFNEPECERLVATSCALVLSAGKKFESASTDSYSALLEHLDANLLIMLEFLTKFIDIRKKLSEKQIEIHVASSVLVDIRRRDHEIYSSTKLLLESCVGQLVRKSKISCRLFVWRIASVQSPLHLGESRAYALTPRGLQAIVRRTVAPGVRYAPKYYFYAARTLRCFPRLNAIIERLYFDAK